MCPSPIFARRFLYLYSRDNGSSSSSISTNIGNRQCVGYYGFHGVSLHCHSPSLSSLLLWSCACPDGDQLEHAVDPSFSIPLNFLPVENQDAGRGKNCTSGPYPHSQLQCGQGTFWELKSPTVLDTPRGYRLPDNNFQKLVIKLCFLLPSSVKQE